MRKIAFAILASALGLFVVSRVVGVPAKNWGYGEVAWAQDSTPADDDEVVQPEPDKKSPPPNVSGSWCGPIEDNLLGSGSITLAINQRGSKLGGTWTDDFGGFGTLSGKIKGTALTAKLRDRASKCKIAVNGILVNPGEVSGTYSQFGCHQADGGSFDITSPSC